jgi:membrane-anchored mycosin MYCP
MLAADSVWPLTRGDGILVAVLSTGVDAGQPQLRGHVRPGFDAVAGKGTADRDCTGTGTQVAGVIAARMPPEGGVAGLAPGADVLPVRILPDDNSGPVSPQAGALAEGVKWAVSHGAQVIVVASPMLGYSDAVRGAVAGAIQQGIVVVAAVGDDGGPAGGKATPYPAAFPDVLGVGSVAADGSLGPRSRRGDYVDLVAPGVAVPTLQRGSGFVTADGSDIAAGFAGAAAALVLAKRGGLLVKQVNALLTATAGATPADAGYGAGVVNPYGAVSNNLTTASPRPLPQLAVSPRHAGASGGTRLRIGLTGAGSALLVISTALLFAAAMRRGRRQRWRPAIAAPLPRPAEPLEPGPPLPLLDESPKRS